MEQSINKITLITPTSDRPLAFELCELYMRRQTVWSEMPIQWVVVDDGLIPVETTLSQTHIRRVRGADSSVQSFCKNWLAALPYVEGDVVVCIEDDDWVGPDYLAQVLRQFSTGAPLVGDDQQRYYHVGERRWRVMDNVGASLCQTAFVRALLPRFESVLYECLAHQRRGVDRALWEATPRADWSLVRHDQVVGIKGLPGRPGIGIGHRPHGGGWQSDADLSVLTAWVGADVSRYRTLGAKSA